MKSITSKRKNFKKDLGLPSTYIGPNGPITYIPAFKLPEGFRYACHIHKMPLLFKTFKHLQIHMQKYHNYRMNIV